MLDLSSNNILGSIPKCLQNLTAMAHKENSSIAYVEIVHFRYNSIFLC